MLQKMVRWRRMSDHSTGQAHHSDSRLPNLPCGCDVNNEQQFAVVHLPRPRLHYARSTARVTIPHTPLFAATSLHINRQWPTKVDTRRNKCYDTRGRRPVAIWQSHTQPRSGDALHFVCSLCRNSIMLSPLVEICSLLRGVSFWQ